MNLMTIRMDDAASSSTRVIDALCKQLTIITFIASWVNRFPENPSVQVTDTLEAS